MDEPYNKKVYNVFLICGILLVLIGFAFIFLKEYKDAYTEIIVGTTFIVASLFFKPAIKWKEMPTGMKVLVVYLWIIFFVGLWNIYTKFGSVDIILGIPIQFPASLIVKPISLFISLIMLIAIYRREWWRLILWLQGFALANYLISSIWFIATPINKLFSLTGQNTSINPQTESIVKLIMVVPLLLGIIIGLTIFIYLYKRKDYFKNS
jgi:hypothetical protein